MLNKKEETVQNFVEQFQNHSLERFFFQNNALKHTFNVLIIYTSYWQNIQFDHGIDIPRRAWADTSKKRISLVFLTWSKKKMYFTSSHNGDPMQQLDTKVIHSTHLQTHKFELHII